MNRDENSGFYSQRPSSRSQLLGFFFTVLTSKPSPQLLRFLFCGDIVLKHRTGQTKFCIVKEERVYKTKTHPLNNIKKFKE